MYCIIGTNVLFWLILFASLVRVNITDDTVSNSFHNCPYVEQRAGAYDARTRTTVIVGQKAV